MIRVGRLIIVDIVTPIAIIWGIAVIPVMAIVAVDARVLAFQHIIIVVDIKSGRFPPGIGRVAGCTLIRKAQVNMVGIGCTIVIVDMTTGTCVRC
jgi:hypothetical protein